MRKINTPTFGRSATTRSVAISVALIAIASALCAATQEAEPRRDDQNIDSSTTDVAEGLEKLSLERVRIYYAKQDEFKRLVEIFDSHVQRNPHNQLAIEASDYIQDCWFSFHRLFLLEAVLHEEADGPLTVTTIELLMGTYLGTLGELKSGSEILVRAAKNDPQLLDPCRNALRQIELLMTEVIYKRMREYDSTGGNINDFGRKRGLL